MSRSHAAKSGEMINYLKKTWKFIFHLYLSWQIKPTIMPINLHNVTYFKYIQVHTWWRIFYWPSKATSRYPFHMNGVRLEITCLYHWEIFIFIFCHISEFLGRHFYSNPWISLLWSSRGSFTYTSMNRVLLYIPISGA